MSDEHEYPSNYRPGMHWASDAAWKILDKLKPGAISQESRCFLAGMIAGSFIQEREASTTGDPRLGMHYTRADIDEIIRQVHAKAAGRTRYVGQQPHWDELLVEEVERLRERVVQLELLIEVATTDAPKLDP